MVVSPYVGSRATTYLAHQTLGNLKLDESCISNPKPENSNWTVVRLGLPSNLRFRDFGFEMQDSSNFKISLSLPW